MTDQRHETRLKAEFYKGSRCTTVFKALLTKNLYTKNPFFSNLLLSELIIPYPYIFSIFYINIRGFNFSSYESQFKIHREKEENFCSETFTSLTEIIGELKYKFFQKPGKQLEIWLRYYSSFPLLVSQF